MNNLKNYDKFNEELKYQTYMSAADKLGKLGHEKRADELIKHATNMEKRKNVETDNNYTWFDDNLVTLEDIVALDHRKNIRFKLTFKYKRYTNAETIIFIYNRKNDELFHKTKEDELGDSIDDQLFSNRPDALKFKKNFAIWMQKNNYAEAIPALNRLSINELYNETKNHRHHYYDDDE
jgi:hypothetical protein